MTLPVSSPSSHSQFDDVGPVLRQGEPVVYPVGGVAVSDTHPTSQVSSPQDVEKRLDEVTKYVIHFIFIQFSSAMGTPQKVQFLAVLGILMLTLKVVNTSY